MTRQEVVSQVKAALHGSGIKAFEWARNVELSDMPCVVIKDTSDTIQDESLYQLTHHLLIEAECYTSSGMATVDDCRVLMSQVAQLIVDGVDNCTLVKSELRVQQDETIIAAGMLSFEVIYLSNRNEV